MMQKSDKWNRANEIDFKHASHTALIVAGASSSVLEGERRWETVKRSRLPTEGACCNKGRSQFDHVLKRGGHLCSPP